MDQAKSIMGIASIAVLAAAISYGQELDWVNPGNYDFTSHLNKTPGDVDVPQGTPPGFDAGIARPSTLHAKVSGMGFLSDGRMVLADWGNFGKNGSIHLLQGMGGDREAVKSTVIAQGIWEPMGVKVIGDAIYYTAQDGIYKLAQAGDKWESTLLSKFIIPIKPVGIDFPIAFNTAYSGDDFYYSTGAYKNFNASPMNQGFVVKMNRVTGAQEILGRGIRMPNGMAANAAGDVFFGDNQGEYRPASSVFHVVKGRHYGMAAPDGKEGNMGGAMTRMLPLPPKDSIFPAAVHIPYRPGSASLTNMFLLDHTPFAGQFLIGDNAFGGVHRVFLEKVKGEYQGAYFQFSGVMDGGVQSFTKGPDGTIYGGTLGHGGNGWSWLGKEEGLMKWKPNGSAFASMISVASHREGFDIRFTDPLAANAANPDWFWVTSYRYEPTATYGGPKMDTRKMKITALHTSADRKTLSLSVDGLEAGRVYRIMLAQDVKTAAGASLWTRNAWYTLNRIGDASPLGTQVSIAPKAGSARSGVGIEERAGRLRVDIAAGGAYSIRVLRLDGSLVELLSGEGPATREMALAAPGLRAVRVMTRNGAYTKLVGRAGP